MSIARHASAPLLITACVFGGTNEGDPEFCDDAPMGVLVEGWEGRYLNSVINGYAEGDLRAAPSVHTTEQNDKTWTKLIAFGETPSPLVIRATKFGAPPDLEPLDVTIEDPVLVITWSFAGSNRFEGYDILDPYLPTRLADGTWVFREYVGNPDDGLLNNWMTAHKYEIEPNGDLRFDRGTILGYLEDTIGFDRSCLNPINSATACEDAISLGVTNVGMPYAFSPLYGDIYKTTAPNTDPHSPPGQLIPMPAPWWQQQLFIFVAERDAFVRPSFNPCLRAQTRSEQTADGRPIWDADAGTYRFPERGEVPPAGTGPSFEAFEAATADFEGYISGVPEPYRGSQGFKDWLQQWQTNSWCNQPDGGPVGPPGSITTDPSLVQGFPFSSVGITLNWEQFIPTQGDDASTDFGALSEMIHNGGESMYLVGVRSGNQYLGLPDHGQKTWCDVCPGDFNRDGKVNGADLAELFANWGEESPCYSIDKTLPRVDILDVSRLLMLWGDCGWPLPDFRPADCD
jgi:hypothetical protein